MKLFSWKLLPFPLLLLTACSTPKIAESEAELIHRVGVVVIGANSIQSPHSKRQEVPSFKIGKSFYSTSIQSVVKSEFSRLGYQAVPIPSENWNRYAFDSKGNFKPWNSKEMRPALQQLAKTYKLSHIFIVGPNARNVAIRTDAALANGFSFYTLNSQAGALKGTNASLDFRAELLNDRGDILAKSSLSQFEKMDPRTLKEQTTFATAPKTLKDKSHEYFKASMPKFRALVYSTGLVAKKVNPRNYNRSPASMPAPTRNPSTKKRI